MMPSSNLPLSAATPLAMARRADISRRVAKLGWYLPLSLALHAALLAVLMLRQPAPAIPVRTERSVAVEIVASAPVARPSAVDISKKDPPPERAALTPDKIMAARRKSAARPNPADNDPDAMVTATRIYSGKALADARSAAARRAMQSLDPEERIIQLCDTEAMEQVHRWRSDFAPDSIVAYATEDPRLFEKTLRADGAAFHSRGNWYAMRFSCDVSADGATVLAFAFRVGKPIPRADWSGYGLVANTDAAD